MNDPGYGEQIFMWYGGGPVLTEAQLSRYRKRQENFELRAFNEYATKHREQVIMESSVRDETSWVLVYDGVD